MNLTAHWQNTDRQSPYRISQILQVYGSVTSVNPVIGVILFLEDWFPCLGYQSGEGYYYVLLVAIILSFVSHSLINFSHRTLISLSPRSLQGDTFASQCSYVKA